jgi:hypothetical protein
VTQYHLIMYPEKSLLEQSPGERRRLGRSAMLIRSASARLTELMMDLPPRARLDFVRQDRAISGRVMPARIQLATAHQSAAAPTSSRCALRWGYA